mmetsp:Transcript_101472/g.227713  ORF Transcript_101472/g.227713 Transcript_101472/m.227713 type:complete len:269 (-) Transcript_101472:81-887(-)
MARIAKAALVLLLPGSEALLVSQSQQAQSEDLSCICMNWADVYKESKHHNVTCGQGMELFSTMDAMNVGLEHNVRNKVALAKNHASASQALEKLKSTLVYKEFCTNFFMKANFNYCVNKRFMPKKDDLHLSKGTWCYVSNKCKLPSATPIPYTDLSAKLCSRQLDETLGKLLIEDAVKLGISQNLDQQMIAGHAYIYRDMNVSEVTEPVLQEIMNAQEGKGGTLVSNSKEMHGKRLVVRGHSVYEHTFNKTWVGHAHWDVKCIRDCYN